MSPRYLQLVNGVKAAVLVALVGLAASGWIGSNDSGAHRAAILSALQAIKDQG